MASDIGQAKLMDATLDSAGFASCVRYDVHVDGMLVIKARLPAEAGQMFIKAIEAACQEMPRLERTLLQKRPASLSIAAVRIPAPAHA